MGKLNPSGMQEIDEMAEKRAEELRVLTSTPFNLKNTQHTKALKKYIDNFEFIANQMYLLQSMSDSVKPLFGTWLAGYVLPIPNFANYMVTSFFCLCCAGWMVEGLRRTDFSLQRKEMQILYNWCLKGGKEKYDSAIDNTETLAHPDIQRMVKLMAPLCTTQFMLAWEKETRVEEQKGGWSNVLSSGYTAFTSTVAFFSSSSKPNIDLNRIYELKVKVETRDFDVGLFSFEKSLKYFATSQEFRDLMAEKISGPINIVKNIAPLIPQPLMEYISPKLQ